ncbi:hypothetical protein RBB77_07370 [Tunturibacter psychrotolerans]|uniref:Uncharacterized protein n=1 Tax=Tunturiibacter psychrotolerans TaxID=3069686 RepID=A0AAU7ZUR0_9BACT
MRVQKAAICIFLASALLLSVPLASELTVSHYRRWYASRLLSALRQIRPGTTTEEQARAALKPFSAYEDGSDTRRAGTVSSQLGYQFYNSPEWVTSLAYHLRFIPIRLTLPWTLFEAHLDFTDGLVAGIHIIEMQEDQPGFPHPNSASVTVVSNRNGQIARSLYDGTPSENFNGYWEYSRSTGQADQSGNPTSFSCCHARFIRLDERATPAERSQALDFQLHCLTSILRCKDDRQILP